MRRVPAAKRHCYDVVRVVFRAAPRHNATFSCRDVYKDGWRDLFLEKCGEALARYGLSKAQARTSIRATIVVRTLPAAGAERLFWGSHVGLMSARPVHVSPFLGARVHAAAMRLREVGWIAAVVQPAARLPAGLVDAGCL